MLPVKSAVKPKEIGAKDVKEIFPVMILMVIVFLLLLFWENEQNEDRVVQTLEYLHVDYPKNDDLVRYCNSMIIQKIIREPDHTCKKEHVFIHERARDINRVCQSPKSEFCHNNSLDLCYQSETKFRMTVCQLIGGTRYPACRYHISPTEAFIIVSCDNMGPIYLQGYVKKLQSHS